MIGHLKGTIASKNVGLLIIDVNGVGYEILISPRTYEKVPPIGEDFQLKIYTHVRENELVLFGFLDTLEKTLFQKLIKVNGIGPRLALNILSGMPPQELIETTLQEDEGKLTSIPGVGKKMAARIVVDLKDKLQDLWVDTATQTNQAPSFRTMTQDVESALINLGYSKTLAEKAVTKLKISEKTTLEALIRESLQNLSGA